MIWYARHKPHGQLARSMPHAEFVMVADAGHSAMETRHYQRTGGGNREI